MSISNGVGACASFNMVKTSLPCWPQELLKQTNPTRQRNTLSRRHYTSEGKDEEDSQPATGQGKCS